jgi:CHAT domain-containing protein
MGPAESYHHRSRISGLVSEGKSAMLPLIETGDPQTHCERNGDLRVAGQVVRTRLVATSAESVDSGASPNANATSCVLTLRYAALGGEITLVIQESGSNSWQIRCESSLRDQVMPEGCASSTSEFGAADSDLVPSLGARLTGIAVRGDGARLAELERWVAKADLEPAVLSSWEVVRLKARSLIAFQQRGVAGREKLPHQNGAGSTSGVSGDAVPHWIEELQQRRGSVHSLLDIADVQEWLLDWHGDPKARLRALAEFETREAWEKPIATEDVEQLRRARVADYVHWVMPIAAVSPDFVLHSLTFMRAASNSIPEARPALLMVEAFALAMAGELGRLNDLVSREEQMILRAVESAYGKKAAASAAAYVELATASASGQISKIFALFEEQTRNCADSFFGKPACFSARIGMAGEAIDASELDVARRLLAPFPSDDLVDEASQAKLIQASYFAELARLAIAESDSKTAQLAYSRASSLIAPGDADAQLALAPVGIRLDLLAGRKAEANSKLELLRRTDFLALPLGGQIGALHELGIIEWLIAKTPLEVGELRALLQREQDFLLDALAEGSAASARSILNSRALRRDRNYSIAMLAGSSGSDLAFAESAWFKGIDEAHAATLSSGSGKDRSLERFTPSFAEVQSMLPPETLVIDFAVFERTELPSFRNAELRLVAVVYGTDLAVSVRDLGEYSDVDRAIKALRAAIVGRDPSAGTLARTLANKLFGKLQADLQAGSRLLIIPDDGLHLVPFDYLQSQAADLLGAGREIIIASSLRQATSRASPRVTDRAAAVISSPDFGPSSSEQPVDRVWSMLPGAAAEGTAVAELFRAKGWAVQSLAGREATESAVTALRSPTMLHFATHGFAGMETKPALGGSRGLRVVAAAPKLTASTPSSTPLMHEGFKLLQSFHEPLDNVGLVLAEANSTYGSTSAHDGVLTGREVAGLPLLGTQLVVLSACETGTGETLRGAAMGSLKRAFHQAGAERVISTLWSIPDEASRLLLTEFYRQLLAGEPPATSLERAKSFVRARPEYVDPLFWAAFQLSGPIGPPAH